MDIEGIKYVPFGRAGPSDVRATGTPRASCTADVQSPPGVVINRAGAQQRAGQRLLSGQVTGRAEPEAGDLLPIDVVAAADPQLGMAGVSRCVSAITSAPPATSRP
jgi:hypothetical protein